MYAVSQRFLDSISGSHRAVVRVQVLPTTGTFPQFGANPVGGTELPVLDGDIRLTSTADVNGTCDFTISGDYWDLLQPYGAELFVQRGVDFGDGTRELVPCGYYGIEEISQDRAPAGPVRVAGADRGRRLQRNRVIYPIEFPPGTTHKTIFDRLVNGVRPAGEEQKNYPMFLDADVPITFTAYDPNLAKIGTSLTCEDDAHAFLAKLADTKGCVLRFNRHGELLVQLRNIPPGATPVYTVRPGAGGNLVSASRKVTREGVYNYVSARGSDPANPTGYRLAWNDDETSPLRWYGPFGVVVRYYASPLVLTNAAADAAAETVLSRYKGLPTSLSMLSVPNPALDPLDVVEAQIGTVRSTHLTDQVSIPLVGSQPVEIVTRTLNEVIVSDEDATGGGGGFPNPTDPGTGGGTDPGTGGGTGTTVPYPTNFTTVVANRVATSTWTVPVGVDATEVHEFLVDPVNTLKATIAAPGNTRTSGTLAGGREYLYAVRSVKGGVYSAFSDRIRVLADFTTRNEGGAGTNPPGTGGTGGGTGGGTVDTTTAAGRNGWGTPIAGDEFNYTGTPNSTLWSMYDGPGHDDNGRRVPARATVDGTKLVGTGLANGDSFGMAHKFRQRYGRWEVRVRSQQDATSNGNDYHPVLIIWPESDNWPEDGEYDFLENGKPGEASPEAYIHYPHDASASVQQVHFTGPAVDLTQWHNFAIEWTSSGIVLYCDGVEWGRASGGANSVRRNIQDMPSGGLTIQLDNFDGTSQTPGRMEVDWVRVYSLVPQGDTGGGTGGGGTSLTSLPDILRLGKAAGLTKVNLGIDFLSGQGPSGKQGTHVDFDLATLENDFTWPGYADIRPNGAVRLTAYVGGATTPNSKYSRTEFRELASDGVAKASWSSTSGTHYVWVKGSIIRLVAGRPHLVIAQIHDASDDLATIRVEGANVVATYGDSGRPGTLATGLQLDSVHQWMLKTVRSGSSTIIQYFWDDMTTPKATQSYGGGSGNYFKAGAYGQASTDHDDQGEQFVMDLYDMEMWHSGYPAPTSRH